MSTTTPAADVRCPQCAALIRAGSDWCTLCYADLRPAPLVSAAAAGAHSPAHASEVASTPTEAAPTSPAPDAVLPTSAAGHDAAERPSSGPASRGKHAKAASTPSAEETEALAAQLLAQLAVAESGSPLGRLSGLTDSSGKKAVLMIGGAFGVVVVLLVFMALLGLVV